MPALKYERCSSCGRNSRLRLRRGIFLDDYCVFSAMDADSLAGCSRSARTWLLPPLDDIPTSVGKFSPEPGWAEKLV